MQTTGCFFHRADKLPPLAINLLHAGQAATHDIEAVAHAGLALRQTLAVWAVEHFEQGLRALRTALKVIRGVDDLDGQVQGLQEDACWEEREPDFICELFGETSEWVQWPADRTNALGIDWGDSGQTRVDKVIVDQWEEAIKETVDADLHTKLRAQHKQADVGEKLPEETLGFGGDILVGAVKQRVGVILCLPGEVLEYFCKEI